MSAQPKPSPFEPILPALATTLSWSGLHGSSRALALARAGAVHPGLVLALVPDSQTALHLQAELELFASPAIPVDLFPDWETLPYDVFSPHQDIISQRLATLYRLPQRRQGILVVPAATLVQRLSPRAYLDGHALLLEKGQGLDLDDFRSRLEAAGYSYVSQVTEHGEFTVRGSLVDLFPMGAELPYRIDLLDEDVDTIRTFDTDSQRSIDKVERVELLPAREFSLTRESITRFRHSYRARFAGDPQQS
ncbi:MAG: transcription-repair coupling factor, partial [Candidatus Competibacteraceae bacterium]|nr:transcription-repair coupling factor [Candidatus Competibacteraceae bacterium]